MGFRGGIGKTFAVSFYECSAVTLRECKLLMITCEVTADSHIILQVWKPATVWFMAQQIYLFIYLFFTHGTIEPIRGKLAPYCSLSTYITFD